MPDLIFASKGTAEVLASQEKIKASAKAMQQAYKDDERAAKDFERAVLNIYRNADSPTKAYNTALGALKKSLDDGKISAAQYDAKVKELGRAFESAKDLSNDLKDANEETFGDSAQGMVTEFVTKLGGILSVIAAGRKGYADFLADVEKGKDAATGSAAMTGQLRQLADTPQEFKRLMGIADRLHLSGAVGSRAEGLEATFALASAGATDDESVKLWEALGQKKVVNIGSMTKSLQTYLSSFGKDEAGTTAQALTKSFAVGKIAPGSVEEVAEAIAGVGSAARAAGLSDEQAGAGIGVLAQAMGTPMYARTALESFIFATEKRDDLAGLPLMQRVQRIQGMGLSAGGLKKLLGDKEALRAQGVLSSPENQQAYGQLLQQVQRANFDTGVIGQKLSFEEPISGTVSMAQKSAAQVEQQFIRQGAAKALLDQIDDRFNRGVRESYTSAYGDNPFGRGAGFAFSGLTAGVQGVQNVTQSPLQRLESLTETDARGDAGLLSEAEERQIRILLDSQAAYDRQIQILESIDRKIGENGGLVVGSE